MSLRFVKRLGSLLVVCTALVYSQGTHIGGGGGSGSGANPSGSGSEIQYRSSGTTLGAVTGSSVSGANVTLTGTFTATQFTSSGTGAGTLTLQEPSATGTDSWAIQAPASITTSYTWTGLATAATGILRGDNSSNVVTLSQAELSGDATTTGSNAVTVAKVNGVANSAAPATDTTPIITASNTATYSAIPNCTDTGGNHLNYTTSTHAVSCGTSGGAGGGSASIGNVSAVTINTNTTADQNMQAISLTAGYLNTAAASGGNFRIHSSGIYTVTGVPTVSIKAKLCTVSGCGSGTVVTLATMTTTATVSASNNQFVFDLDCGTTATGASGTLICHGILPIDQTSGNATATAFIDTNTAASSAIDLTAALFLQFTAAFSTGSASNTVTDQHSYASPLGGAGVVTSVNGSVGAVTPPGMVMALMNPGSFASPADSTTYYAGQGGVASTTYNNVRYYVQKACTVKAVTYTTVAGGTVQSNESYNQDIFQNGTTQVTGSSAAFAAATATVQNQVTGLSYVLAAGDYIALRIVTPAWGTNPTSMFWRADVYCE